jgi:hypothetical protein
MYQKCHLEILYQSTLTSRYRFVKDTLLDPGRQALMVSCQRVMRL